jgi:hypothetical protein
MDVGRGEGRADKLTSDDRATPSVGPVQEPQQSAEPAPPAPDPAEQTAANPPQAAVAAGSLVVAGRRGPAEREAGLARLGGVSFARLTVAPALLLAAWLLPGLPLLLAGAFLPVPMALISAPLAVLLIAGFLGRIPSRWPRAIPGPGRDHPAAAWWAAAGTVAVAAGFGCWQFLEAAQNLIVLRDPGAYLQTGYWLAQHGSLPIPASPAAFGGAHGLGFSSTGFFASGGSVVPGFLSGLPLLLAGAFWAHGFSGAMALGPVLGALAVLSFGGLTGRLAGPAWAPAGALVLALTLPEQYTSRSAFTETAAQVLLFGGLSLIIDTLTLDRAGERAAGPSAVLPPGAETAAFPVPRWRWLPFPLPARGWRPSGRRLTAAGLLAGCGGLVLGLTVLLRIDALGYLLPAIPFAGLLVAGRRGTAAAAFLAGLAVGAGYGLADGFLLARPFLDSLRPRPELVGIVAAWLAAATLAATELAQARRFRAAVRRLPAGRIQRLAPAACGALVIAALAVLAARPYFQIVRGPAHGAAAGYVAHLQRLQHLAVDPGRTYAEDTLYWVIWYAGVPAVLLGGFGFAILVSRGVRGLLRWRDPGGAARNWALPLAVIGCGSALALWRPDILPDQPWASRRLVPLVLPGFILCAVWASAWLRGLARDRGAGRSAASVAGAFCVAALLVPTTVTTFGLGLSHAGNAGGLHASEDGMALERTGAGQAAAVRGLCASIPRPASVVILDRLVAARFTQVVRGMCGVPAARVTGQPAGAVRAVLARIRRAGRRPVLLGASRAELAPFGGSPVRVVHLVSTQDPHQLTQPPTRLMPIRYEVWLSAPSGPGSGI